MERKMTIWFGCLMAAVGAAAVAPAIGPGPAKPGSDVQTVKRKRAADRGNGIDARLAVISTVRQSRPQRGSEAGTSSGMQGQPAGPLCTQPAGNCQTADQENARRSDRITFFVADDFVPASDGSISEICWRGGYFNSDRQADCAGDVTEDRFQIRYLEDAGGVPGECFAQFRQEQVGTPLVVSGPVLTGDQIAGLIDEYEYTATHTPVPVTAGQCYWVEISNLAQFGAQGSECAWWWEDAVQGNDWAMQDNEDDHGLTECLQGDGYDTADSISDDKTFCLDLPLDDAGPCVPTPPVNDTCAEATGINTAGIFEFDNTTARTDGPGHAACHVFGEDQIEADVWFCWTAPCTEDAVVVSTCDMTELDTRIAVYEGCDACPPTDDDLLACNDDRCVDNLARLTFQSFLRFSSVAGQSYLIRIGVFPGAQRGSGSFAVSCGPPDNVGCPGDGSCCDETGTGSPGCDDEACCEIVCACDPFCCGITWEVNCATTGLGNSGCGAELLCLEVCNVCGSPAGGDCCNATPGTPGCSDAACCETVCEADHFCCENQWDEACATTGFKGNGNGARILCPDLCTCPAGASRGDSDGDDDVDVIDVAFFQYCFGFESLTPDEFDLCLCVFDSNDDGNINLDDWHSIESILTGP